eukprot:584371-Prymnesium_polylepis.1
MRLRSAVEEFAGDVLHDGRCSPACCRPQALQRWLRQTHWLSSLIERRLENTTSMETHGLQAIFASHSSRLQGNPRCVYHDQAQAP